MDNITLDDGTERVGNHPNIIQYTEPQDNYNVNTAFKEESNIPVRAIGTLKELTIDLHVAEKGRKKTNVERLDESSDEDNKKSLSSISDQLSNASNNSFTREYKKS